MKAKRLVFLWSVLVASFGCFVIEASGAPQSFDELWKSIEARSPGLQAQSARLRAARAASDRASLHWIPKLFLEARAFSTNDPATNFFSNLSQRAVGAGDFVPATLNTPGTNSFVTAGLGIDFALFEGGMRAFTARAEEKLLMAEEIEQNAAYASAYSAAARDYARLISIDSSRDRLLELQSRLAQVLERYSVGASGNPVGYSGWLGLKGLKNRLETGLLELDSERSALHGALALQAGDSSRKWEPVRTPLTEFLERHLRPVVADRESLAEKSASLRGEAQGEWKRAERARFLPRVGIFGNENLAWGARATGTSTTVGVYLRWSLLDPENLGRVAEGSHRESAARFSAEAASLEREMQDQALLSGDAAIRKNLVLLLDSEGLLSEQARVSFRLFQSGAIQALQLAEVLNRRIDLVFQLKKLEQQWIQVQSDLSRIHGVPYEQPIDAL